MRCRVTENHVLARAVLPPPHAGLPPLGLRGLLEASWVVAMAGVGKRLIPLLDRILVERFVPEAKTKGGIMIPEKAQAKVHSATVVAVGPGARTESGQTIPIAVKEGDKVLLPEYGGTKVEIENKEFYIFRDSDVLGKWAD
ncbi:hypothetical protein MTO96_015350 [Rhipicephalus appendiculatus]